MFNAIVKIRQWWNTERAPALPVVPFEVACVCGRVVNGLRKAKQQVFACPECGRSLFIFPVSPLPALAPTEGQPKPSLPLPAAPGQPFWFWPAVAGGATLAVVLVIFAFVLSYLASNPPGTDRDNQPTAGEVEAQWALGRKSLASGYFPQAEKELAAARAMLDRQPDMLSAPEARKLLNQQREAALLAEWAAKGSKAPEKLFENLNNDPDLVREYRGRVLVFDAEVRREVRGGYHVDHRRPKLRDLVRLDLADFKLLQRLPLQEPQRLIFAGRLADAQRQAGDPWTVRLEPDSGVLLTDVETASICTFEPVDAGMEEVIRRQREWVANPP